MLKIVLKNDGAFRIKICASAARDQDHEKGTNFVGKGAVKVQRCSSMEKEIFRKGAI